MLERDRKLLRETAAFLTDVVIPRMVRECVQLTLVPTDGESLKTAMHARGINMRYLGRIATLASSREDLEHLKVGGVVQGSEYHFKNHNCFGCLLLLCMHTCVCAEAGCE